MLFLLHLITSSRISELSEIGSVPLISDNRGSTVREEQYCAFCWPGVPSVAALTRRSVTLAVADASGRYTPSFFWGNSYWTGSESLCHQLNSNTPPFLLGFYTVRLQIALPHNISPRVSIFFPIARQPLGGLDRLIFRRFTITHTLDTPHSVGLLWTSDQSDAETST
jgi:hypothetical protein